MHGYNVLVSSPLIPLTLVVLLGRVRRVPRAPQKVTTFTALGEALISYTNRNFLCGMPCAYILSCSYSFADNRSRGWRERCSRLLHFPKITLLVAFILYRRSCVNIHTLIFCTSSTFVEILFNAANMSALVWWCALVFSIFVYPP